ncbi:hypothetical protein [Edwardsiella tarda]|uniref:hypothetical protein n=1 Tax=Edwardsiella tarda TaxID=636 RepID=UPI003B50CCA5
MSILSLDRRLRACLLFVFYWYNQDVKLLGYRLSVIGYRLSVIGYRLSVIGYRLSVIGGGAIPLTSSLLLTGAIAFCCAYYKNQLSVSANTDTGSVVGGECDE